jgi:hypothetical protein
MECREQEWGYWKDHFRIRFENASPVDLDGCPDLMFMQGNARAHKGIGGMIEGRGTM